MEDKEEQRGERGRAADQRQGRPNMGGLRLSIPSCAVPGCVRLEGAKAGIECRAGPRLAPRAACQAPSWWSVLHARPGRIGYLALRDGAGPGRRKDYSAAAARRVTSCRTAASRAVRRDTNRGPAAPISPTAVSESTSPLQAGNHARRHVWTMHEPLAATDNPERKVRRCPGLPEQRRRE